MTLGSAVLSDRLVLAVRAMAIKLSTAPEQPQVLVALTPTLTEQRDVVLVYELKLRHAGAELK